jgi:hypothetical protein
MNELMERMIILDKISTIIYLRKIEIDAEVSVLFEAQISKQM